MYPYTISSLYIEEEFKNSVVLSEPVCNTLSINDESRGMMLDTSTMMLLILTGPFT